LDCQFCIIANDLSRELDRVGVCFPSSREKVHEPAHLVSPDRIRFTRWFVILLIPLLMVIEPARRPEWAGDLMEALGAVVWQSVSSGAAGHRFMSPVERLWPTPVCSF
jgi:hypothetical protein